MMYDGVDYTLPAIAVLSFLVLFTVQYLLCRYCRSGFLRSLPWLWVIAALGLALTCFWSDTGGWIDLRALFALLFCGYAAICAAGIGAAHLVYRLQKQ